MKSAIIKLVDGLNEGAGNKKNEENIHQHLRQK